MRMRKIFAAVALLLILTSVLCVRAFAEEVPEDELPTPSPSESWLQEVYDTIDTYQNGSVNVVYTADSVHSEGISWGSSIDVLTKNVYFEIVNELPAGYVVYDDPETPYIDGIRLNGNTVDSYKVAIDWTQDIDYEIVVRVTYDDSFVGTLAQMSDGTYDWVKLLENPIGLLMALYYVLATVSVVAGFIMLLFGKNKKTKTANDISNAVEAKAQETAKAIIKEEIMPIVSSFQNTAQALVKAYALTTSKSKEAPLALLDVLQDVSNADAESVITQAKDILANARAVEESARAELVNQLHNIADTSQEVLSNGTEQQKQEQENLAIF